MSTQTKQQRHSDEPVTAPLATPTAEPAAGVVTAAAPAQVAAAAVAADKSLTNEPNNNNNNTDNHEKKITTTNVAGSRKSGKQKLTSAKLNESNGSGKSSSTGAKGLPTNSTKTTSTTTTNTIATATNGQQAKQQQRDESSARMGSVISFDESSSAPPSPLRVVAGDEPGSVAAQQHSDGDEQWRHRRQANLEDGCGDGDDASRDNEQKRAGETTGRKDRQPDIVEQAEQQQQQQPLEVSQGDAKRSPRQHEEREKEQGEAQKSQSTTDSWLPKDQQANNKLKQIAAAAGQLPQEPQRPLVTESTQQVDTLASDLDKQAAANNCHHKALLKHQQQPDTKRPADQLELGPAAFDHQTNNNNNLNHHHHNHHHHQQHHNLQHNTNHSLYLDYKPATTRRLSYLQSLLLRKWPCLALTICIMSSLLFGILLSGLTLYLMHGVGGGVCSELASHLAAASSSGVSSQHHLRHQHHSANLLPHELVMDASPIEAAGVAASLADSPPPELTHRQLTDAPSKSAVAAAAPAFQRLTGSVVPQHYELFIWPHIAPPSFHFNGSVEIHLTCKSPTDNITLHTLELDIDESSLKLLKLPTKTGGATRLAAAASSSGGQNVPKVSRLSQDKQLQYSIIHLDGMLEPEQDYLLRMDFVGSLNDDLAGFYKIKYERQNTGEINWIAATQFQATDARRAFPCFDEPLYKATFGIRLKHWKNMTALSNMPIVSSEESSDGLWITDTFARSQRMSTYLVAFAVTNFESRTAGNITVWTRPGFVHTADYALSIAGKILRHYEDFFGIAYPLPKMDMIALPDFNAGAMENWGLITYRETAMLYDENSSSVANKQRVAVVVAHELAHQWFGNLVTPKWWDDLWLNEGFASFVEYIGVDHVEPKWRMLDQFVVDEVQNVFKLDGLSSSHQISIPVNNPDEISEIFDHISYAKGASIIRMMNHFLTDRVFKAGLQRYLKALKYSNAEQSDLWAHLTAAQEMFRRDSNGSLADNLEAIDVGQVMNSWTLQTGYPLVTLTRDYNKNTAQLEQVRYQPYKLQEETMGSSSNKTSQMSTTSDRESALASERKLQQRWDIPITYTWKSDQNWRPITRLWMRQNQSGPVELVPSGSEKTTTTTNQAVAKRFPGVPANEWMIVNIQQVGYYRVNYDLQNWKLLIEQLQKDHTQIGETNRAQLLDDIFELAKSSLIDYQLAMEATKYLKMEREYLPWESVLLSFGYIDDMLLRTSIYGDWQDYFAQLIEPYYERYKDLDWTRPQTKSNSTEVALKKPSTAQEIDANDVLEHYNQVNAVAWACAVNNEHCIQKALAAFKDWKTTGVNNIKPALRLRAYSTAIEFGNKDDWDFLWRVYEKEQNASERDRILRALGCSRELWILSRYLEWTFSKTKPIRRQDGSFVFRVVAKNNHGRDIAFNFMRERWSVIKEYYGKSSFSLGSLIKSVATLMNTQLELDQLRTFYETIKGDVGTGKRSFQIAIEEVESNVYWRNRNFKILEKWLQEQRASSK